MLKLCLYTFWYSCWWNNILPPTLTSMYYHAAWPSQHLLFHRYLQVYLRSDTLQSTSSISQAEDDVASYVKEDRSKDRRTRSLESSIKLHPQLGKLFERT